MRRLYPASYRSTLGCSVDW